MNSPLSPGPNFPNATAKNVSHNFGIERKLPHYNLYSFRLTHALVFRVGKYDHNAFGTLASLRRCFTVKTTCQLKISAIMYCVID